MSRRLTKILIPVALILYLWPLFQAFSSRHKAFFALPDRAPKVSMENSSPFMRAGFIAPDMEGTRVHAGSICKLPDGRLAAVWYGGSREGAKDVGIFLAMRKPDTGASWSKPRLLVDRAMASRELDRHIKKVGNAVLFAGPDRRVHLIYVTVTLGGWSGSSLNVKVSEDGGDTWSRSRRLTLSPFFNISELVRNKPVFMTDGRMAVPIYHECMGHFPELLWLDPTEGNHKASYRKTRMAGGNTFLQPSVVPRTPLDATAFYRCRSEKRAMGTANTKDAGASWSEPRFLALPNPDAGLDVVGLSDGSMLMAFNDTPVGRENLKLALSHDGGKTWRRIATLENSPGREFSYPYMISTPTGQIHLVYTWNRKRIKHLTFNEAWVHGQRPGGAQ